MPEIYICSKYQLYYHSLSHCSPTQGQTEAEIPPSETNFTLTNCSEGATDYYCGNCSFHKSLPLASQSYRYRVVISPGKISPTVAYTIGKCKRFVRVIFVLLIKNKNKKGPKGTYAFMSFFLDHLSVLYLEKKSAYHENSHIVFLS